jgi:hypothetical protein
MKLSFDRTKLALVGGLLLANVVAFADGTRFSDFTPLASSAGPTADESMPITFGNPDFQQRSIADRNTQLFMLKPNTGVWDMTTVNETGAYKGRYLFTVFESFQSGVQRHNVLTGETDTIWHSLALGDEVRFDACFWTPWGTLITAEEEWTTVGEAEHPVPYGRLFELKNPNDAPAMFTPLTPFSNDGADFVHRNVIPRTSHEGIQFDNAGNMYFIDELNGGNIYKFTSRASWGEIMSGRAEYFAAGQTSVLRVGDGNTPNATGAYTWVPFTNADGAALPGALVITDANGITSVDARNTTDLAQFKGTDYQRPEDLQVQKVRDRQYLYPR